MLPPATPPEAPGVLVVHPLERWSLVDLVVGLGRLIRGAGTAAVRA